MEGSPRASNDVSFLMLTAGATGLRVFDPQCGYKPVYSSLPAVDLLDVRAHSSGRFVIAHSKQDNSLQLGRFVGTSRRELEWSDCGGLAGRCVDVIESDAGCQVVVGKAKRTAVIVDLSVKKPGRTISLRDDPVAVASIGKGEGVAVGLTNGGDVHVYGGKQWTKPDIYDSSKNDILNDVRSSLAHDAYIGAAYESGNVAVWDIVKKERLLRLKPHVKNGAKSFVFSPGNRNLAGSCSTDGFVVCLGLDVKKPVKKLRVGLPLSSITFIPQSSQIAVGTQTGVVQIWDLRSPKEAVLTVEDAGVGPVNSISFCICEKPSEFISPHVLTEQAVRLSPAVASDGLVASKRISSVIEDAAAKENSPPYDVNQSPSAGEIADAGEVRRQPIGEARSDPTPNPILSPPQRAPVTPSTAPVPSPIESAKSGREDRVFSPPNCSPFTPTVSSVGSSDRAPYSGIKSPVVSACVTAEHGSWSGVKSPHRSHRLPSSGGPGSPRREIPSSRTRASIAGSTPRTSNVPLSASAGVLPEFSAGSRQEPVLSAGQARCANCERCVCASAPPVTKEDVQAIVKSCLADFMKKTDSSDDDDDNGNATPASSRVGPLTNDMTNELERIVGNMVSIFLRSHLRSVEKSLSEVQANISRQIAESDAKRDFEMAALREELRAAAQSGGFSMWLQ